MRRSNGFLVSALALLTLARCSCNNGSVGSCANGAVCPVNSSCNSSDFLCFPNGDGGSAGNGGATNGGSGGGYQCYSGPCPTGYTCNPNTFDCELSATSSSSGSGGTGGVVYCSTTATCPTGDVCQNHICVPSSNGSAGSNGGNGNSGNNGGSATAGSTNGGSAANSAGSSGGNGGNAGNNGGGNGIGGSNGGYQVTGECFDGGTCPAGSSCNQTGLCIAPLTSGGNGGASTGGYFYNGTGGGNGGQGICGPGTPCQDAGAEGDGGVAITGLCSGGATCPAGSVCASNGYCYGIVPKGTGGWGNGGNGGGNGGAASGGTGGAAGGGTGGGCDTTGCGQSCSVSNPGACASGLFCDPLTNTCQLPQLDEPCEPNVGCQGANVTCVAALNQAPGTYYCAQTCTSTSQCSPIVETCQPSPEVQANTCQIEGCNNFFLPCTSESNNDGTCLLPSPSTVLTGACPQGGCGTCEQGGSGNLGNGCGGQRGQTLCEPAATDPTDPGGMVCEEDVNGGSNTACMPQCSPLNGPTLCPLGMACYWPPGNNVGACVIVCPVDPLCPVGAGVGSDCGFCGDSTAAQLAETFLCGGLCCITECPGNLSCQFIPGTPILACLP